MNLVKSHKKERKRELVPIAYRVTRENFNKLLKKIESLEEKCGVAPRKIFREIDHSRWATNVDMIWAEERLNHIEYLRIVRRQKK